MDILGKVKKEASNMMKDAKKREKAGDAIEGVLKTAKKSVKDEKSKKTLDKVIKAVDSATSQKKKKK
ncbi:MAG: hypothetical protein IJI22_04905 [Bacilli bacterium]|nr:hypothetical protein [Bacilli bacterium]